MERGWDFGGISSRAVFTGGSCCVKLLALPVIARALIPAPRKTRQPSCGSLRAGKTGGGKLGKGGGKLGKKRGAQKEPPAPPPLAQPPQLRLARGIHQVVDLLPRQLGEGEREKKRRKAKKNKKREREERGSVSPVRFQAIKENAVGGAVKGSRRRAPPGLLPAQVGAKRVEISAPPPVAPGSQGLRRAVCWWR